MALGTIYIQGTATGIEQTDAGLERRRILPFSTYSERQTLDKCHNLFCEVMAHNINGTDQPAWYRDWPVQLRSMLCGIYEYHTYDNFIDYFEKLLDCSLQVLSQFNEREMHLTKEVTIPDETSLPRALVPSCLRLLYTLGYQWEGVDRVENMTQVILQVPGTANSGRLENIRLLITSIKALTLPEVRFLLSEKFLLASELREIIHTALACPHEALSQSTMDRFWTSGHKDFVESLGFKKKKRIPYGNYVFSFTHKNVECRRKARATYFVLKLLSQPSNPA